MKVVFDGHVIAETRHGIEMNDHYYFPETAIDKSFLQISDTPVSVSIAGEQIYYDILIDDKIFKDAAFLYINPHPWIDDLKYFIAFHEENVTEVEEVDSMNYMTIEFWRQNAKSITKYNPKNRDENGYYLKDEWSCISDIGKTFDGELLTADEYYEVEQHYATAATKFFLYHDCKQIRIADLHKFEWENSYADADTLLPVYNQISENSVVPIDEITQIVKLALRGDIQVSLFCEDSQEVAIRFGYDYYMYFNTNREADDLYKDIEALGLSVW